MKKNIFIELSQALKFLYDNGVIHGDIKPDNILLTKQYDVRLTDFSLSQVCTEDHIEINDICGTPRYVAPEYINTEYDEDS